MLYLVPIYFYFVIVWVVFETLQERRELQEKREAQTVAWMSNFTSMFGGSATTSSGTAARTGAALSLIHI